MQLFRWGRLAGQPVSFDATTIQCSHSLYFFLCICLFPSNCSWEFRRRRKDGEEGSTRQSKRKWDKRSGLERLACVTSLANGNMENWVTVSLAFYSLSDCRCHEFEMGRRKKSGLERLTCVASITRNYTRATGNSALV